MVQSLLHTACKNYFYITETAINFALNHQLFIVINCEQTQYPLRAELLVTQILIKTRINIYEGSTCM